MDQLAARGFKVRAGVRDAQKSAWLPGLIAERNPGAPAVELVEIPDLAKAGALDEALKGAPDARKFGPVMLGCPS